ncbi:hypothetical protein BJY01DRAFT_245210 [Aspergillus pseudoustus]|uniref:F5/8 type C domain-containing protein n=1 Tax=Aspergillus pseudoustus TaxID=1810923 RepID=A0ABR4KFP7_9EURO
MRPLAAILVAVGLTILPTISVSALPANDVALEERANKYSAIPNGQRYLDTDGNPISAYGPGFLKVDDTWYWVGQDLSSQPAGELNPGFVNLYKSKDLTNWDFVNTIVDVNTQDVYGNRPFTMSFPGRPKLLYNKPTKKYVLWIHWELQDTFSPSEVIIATADDVSGPYTVTREGHRRPGAGNNGTDAMGDRLGAPKLDYDTGAKDENDHSHPAIPAQFSYPPKISQYNPVDPKNLSLVDYLSQEDGYGLSDVDPWTFILDGFKFNTTLKARAVRMTPWDDTYYQEYKDKYDVRSESSIVRYPTEKQSPVTKVEYIINDQPEDLSKLSPPVIGPTLAESKSNETVFVNSGDAAFLIVQNRNAQIYYTTDGSAPSPGNGTSSKRYWDGTRLAINGKAGTKLTVKAISVLGSQKSSIVSQTYEIAADPLTVPVFKPIINRPSGTYQVGSGAFGWQAMRIYCPSYNTECYYTLDGADPNPPQKGDNIGLPSRDFTVWVDPKTEEAYLITTSDHIYGRVWKLTDDYTDVVPDKEFDAWVGDSLEAPALIRNGGADGEWVYMTLSQQSGWYPNQNFYTRFRDLNQGFEFPRDEYGYRDGSSILAPLQPFGDASTYKSQSSYIIDVSGRGKQLYVFVGDRYNTVSGNLGQSTYVFMPLTLDDNGKSESSNSSSGGLTATYYPDLPIDVANHRIKKTKWRLLSLGKPVKGSPSVQPTLEEAKSGTVNYNITVANDGVNFDVDAYDSVAQYYRPPATPFYWRVDLEDSYALSWIGLSFRSVSGSDAATRYLVYGSNDDTQWDLLVDNTQNGQPGFADHKLSGRYRYVKVTVTSVFDVAHGKGADWQLGVYEISVYGQ